MNRQTIHDSLLHTLVYKISVIIFLQLVKKIKIKIKKKSFLQCAKHVAVAITIFDLKYIEHMRLN